jgi:acyl-CoA thioester hydrolase
MSPERESDPGPDADADAGARQAGSVSPRYRVNVPLRWSDMDAYGHVNNVQFLRLLEDARVIGFEGWFGQDRSVLSEGILVTRHEIEYLAPLLFRLPPIVVEMWATKIGGAGFDLAYEVRDGRATHDGGGGDVVDARAETGLVLYDFANTKPRRMDPLLRSVLERHSGDPVPFRWRRR